MVYILVNEMKPESKFPLNSPSTFILRMFYIFVVKKLFVLEYFQKSRLLNLLFVLLKKIYDV